MQQTDLQHPLLYNLKLTVMKKTITLSILCLLSFSLFAQVKKGAALIGADLSLSGTNNNQTYGSSETKSSTGNFNISLLAGWAIKENLLVGGALSFASSGNKQQGNTMQSLKTYGASVWLRKYFPVTKSFYAFVNGAVGGSTSNNNQKNTGTIEKGFGVAIILYPGISYQLTKSCYLDASLNNLANIYYNHNSSDRTDALGNRIKYTTNNYGLSTSLGNGSNPLQLGVRWIIQK